MVAPAAYLSLVTSIWKQEHPFGIVVQFSGAPGLAPAPLTDEFLDAALPGSIAPDIRMNSQ
jgi:hypothetical protein